MIRRKLEALQYPLLDSLDLSDELKYRNLVVWLEDQKIRYYKVEDRDELRNINSPDWSSSFNKYLEAIGVPKQIESQKLNEVMDWLVSFAVRLEYTDNVEKYAKTSPVEQETQAPTMVTVNPLDKLDFSSTEFIQGVNKIADQLEIMKHPNHLITLQAIATLVKTRMSSKSLENLNGSKSKGKPFPITEYDMGFPSGDYVLNTASKILRLLYIHDLRDLQTRINECIVALQVVTANPKTDTKLGKAGF